MFFRSGTLKSINMMVISNHHVISNTWFRIRSGRTIISPNLAAATKILEPSTMAEEDGLLHQFTASRKSRGTSSSPLTIPRATKTSNANVSFLAFFQKSSIVNIVSYRVGYKSSNPAHTSITTKREMSSVVKSLYLGGSMEASVGHSSTSDSETHVELKQTFTVPRGTNFWICQRVVDLKVFNTDDTVRIWDSELIVNGRECEECTFPFFLKWEQHFLHSNWHVSTTCIPQVYMIR